MNKALFSSKSDEWETPQDLFDILNEYFNFTLDPASTKENAKCEKFYTKKENGLIQSWKGEKVFLNPPYGKEISKWIKKAFEEGEKGTLVVMLIPARVDTSYWHKYCMKGDCLFLKGRLKFKTRIISSKTTSAPFPSAIVVFGGWKSILKDWKQKKSTKNQSSLW